MPARSALHRLDEPPHPCPLVNCRLTESAVKTRRICLMYKKRKMWFDTSYAVRAISDRLHEDSSEVSKRAVGTLRGRLSEELEFSLELTLVSHLFFQAWSAQGWVKVTEPRDNVPRMETGPVSVPSISVVCSDTFKVLGNSTSHPARLGQRRKKLLMARLLICWFLCPAKLPGNFSKSFLWSIRSNINQSKPSMWKIGPGIVSCLGTHSRTLLVYALLYWPEGELIRKGNCSRPPGSPPLELSAACTARSRRDNT